MILDTHNHNGSHTQTEINCLCHSHLDCFEQSENLLICKICGQIAICKHCRENNASCVAMDADGRTKPMCSYCIDVENSYADDQLDY